MILFSQVRHFPELSGIDNTARRQIMRSCQRDAAMKIQRSSVLLIGAILFGLCMTLGSLIDAVPPALLVAVVLFLLWWRHRVVTLMRPLIHWELKRYLRQHSQSQLRTVQTWVKTAS